MHIAVLTNQGWRELPEAQASEACRLLSECKRLRLMLACDLGWTGMVFQEAGYAWKAWESEEHVVDVRRWQGASPP